jgi:cell fate (sporulation/competence/biofilm development) regulator YlbF (YheA/YmcA/DUF963 family)
MAEDQDASSENQAMAEAYLERLTEAAPGELSAETVDALRSTLIPAVIAAEQALSQAEEAVQTAQTAGYEAINTELQATPEYAAAVEARDALMAVQAFVDAAQEFQTTAQRAQLQAMFGGDPAEAQTAIETAKAAYEEATKDIPELSAFNAANEALNALAQPKVDALEASLEPLMGPVYEAGKAANAAYKAIFEAVGLEQTPPSYPEGPAAQAGPDAAGPELAA